MTKFTLAPMGPHAKSSLEPHVPAFWSSPGGHLVAVVEIRHLERTEVAAGSGEPSVKAQIVGLEIPGKESETAIRELMAAMHFVRTARGTFDELDGTRLDEQSREIGGALGSWAAMEAAASHAAMLRAAEELDAAAGNHADMNDRTLRRRMEEIATNLRRTALTGEQVSA